MKRYGLIQIAILLLLVVAPMRVDAQSVVNMINGDSIILDACQLGGGTIYDDGGTVGGYSNSFDGYVLIQASADLTITLTGNYDIETCCDHLTVTDGVTTLLSTDGSSETGMVNVSTTTGLLRIHFVSDGAGTRGGFALNWIVTGIGTACPNPVTLLDTTLVTATTIGLTWSALNTAGPFSVICGDRVFSGITTTSYTLTNLNPSTTYSISVVDAASSDNRCCAAHRYVRTDCGNVSLPYSEGFEDMAEGSFPNCWLQVRNFDFPEEYLPQVVSAQHSSGSRSLLLSCGNSESAGHFGIVATPPIEGVGVHTVRLMLRASHSGTYVEFGTCDSAGTEYNQYGFTVSQGVYVDNTSNWQEYRITWTSAANGRRLALRMQQSQQDGVGRRLYIDDMGVENCGVDSLRAMHVEFDQLQLVWSTYGNPTCNVGVRREGALTDTLTFLAETSPLQITGLASDTRYVFTVYPTCGSSLSISRSVTARTAPMPTAADGYCSDFSQGYGLPNDWTFRVLSAFCGGNFTKNNRAIHIYDGCGGVDAYMASERLMGLAGKQVAVTFSGYNNGAMVIVGTMVHADDTATFVPLDTAYSDGGRHTMVVTVPTSSTGRHIAIHLCNPNWYVDLNFHSVTCSSCAVEEAVVEHRRGTSMVISWAQPYDTVLVQYGLEGFALGTGTVDTFYNVVRGTITGLTPSTNYDLFVYRPCQVPCEDMRYMRRTATRDYPLPYCEDFSSLTGSEWDYNWGDWRQLRTIYNRPSFEGHPYYGTNNHALVMSSWGFHWDYYSMVMLPDVDVDSHAVLSFYIYDQAPQSTIIVGVAPENNEWPYEHFQVLDTVHINAHNRRVHYNYVLRPSDTLFNNRLVIAYQHPHEYSYYNCYIDEIQLQHHYYGTLQTTYVSFDTAHFNLTSLQGGSDSVEITLDGGGNTFVDTVLLADIHGFGFGGLDTGTLYMCYVRPLSEGCSSYAGYIITSAYGGGYGNCFPFSNELSDELPYHWAADSTTLVTTDEYLQLQPHGSVATHPMQGLSGLSFMFRARSHTVGDTLLLGSLPADSISTDSTHYTSALASLIAPIDTFVLDTNWQYYMLRLPQLGGGDTLRLVFRVGSDTLDLDEVEITGCPIVHFEVDGNSIVCTLDNDQLTNYYLTIEDSTGTDSRVMYVETNPYRISGLKMDMRYNMSWYCPFDESECRPTISLRTGGLIPLPYCEDFNSNTARSISVPPTWTFITQNNNYFLGLDTWGPSLRMDSYGNGWMYAVLPAMAVDSVLSLHARIHSWTPGGIQIGVMDNATDTSSFVPLWTSPNTDWHQPEIDLSAYTDKRVAIRTNAEIRIWNLHLYGYPLAKYSLIGHKHLKVTTEAKGPYWLHLSNPWESNRDTMFYVDTTVFYIYDTTITTDGHVYINQTDSTGFTCEDDQYYYLSGIYNLPACYSEGCGGLRAFNYQPYNQPGMDDCFDFMSSDYRRVHRFHGNSSSWMVMHDMNIDSVQHAGMRVHYNAGSTLDTMVVGVMVDAYDTLTFTPLDTLVYTIGDSLQWAYVDLTRYADTGRWIAFHHLYAPNGQWFDIHYVYLESCPGALSATASLSRWNRVKIDGKQVPFYVEYGYSGYGQGHGANTILRVDSVPLILTLDPETRYDFYFRCDSLEWSCVPKQCVTTLAAPLEVPTCVDFDTVVVDAIPHNWTSRNAEIGASNVLAHSGAHSLRVPVGASSYIITPDINVDSIQKIALSVWYQVEDLGDRLVVGVMSNPSDISTFHPVRTLAPVETGIWQRGVVEFSLAPSDAHFIALRARSNRQGGGRNIYLDDIYITDCAAFDFTVQRLTNNSIDLTWSHLGNPSVTVTVEDDDVVTGTYTNLEPPLHIEPLDMLHYYTFRFNSTCDSTDTSYCSTNYTDSLSVVTPAQGTGCVNPTDLASPQAVFFSGTYHNPYSHAGAINYGSMHPDSRHTVCYDTAQRDPRTGNQLRTIPEGYTSSVRLGNWSTNYYTPEAEGVIYSLFVDTTSFELLLLRYAAVLQDPVHASEDQPRFRMELLDTNYNIIDSACTSADFIADQSLGWNTAPDGVLWKDWTAVGVDLSSHAGQQVYFRLTTFDCNEGSHYGYAYFTLECMRKNMNTVSCGDVDSNTLSAPEGFHYRWYTSQSNATVSTAQSIRVPSEDITYFCEVSKLDNAACQFLIRAYGGTRYPKASFDTSMVIDSCRFYVTFTNTGGVSNDGMTLIPGERCETTYWDFGNGTVSTGYNGSATYLTPGTYTVRLVSGVAFDACQDTAVMTLVLDLPPGMAPSDTTVMSICDNEQYTFFGEPYNTTGTFYHNVPVVGNPCDSIYVLQLDVRATSVGDTSAIVCDSIFWHGTTYTDDGVYPDSTVGPNSVLCDSTIVLTLAVHPTYDTVDTLVICPYRPYVYEGVDYGGPVTFDTILYSVFVCDSVVHVTLQSRDSNYRLASYFHFDSADWQQPDSVLTGCAPSTLYMADSTEGAEHWLWTLFAADTQFTSTERNISYIVPIGRDSVTAFVSLIVEDEVGCFDTIGWPLFVFPPPEPEFRWDPLVPSINSPEVRLLNLSTPLREEMEENHSIAYLWRIQKAEGGEFDTSSEYELRYHWGEEGDNMAGDYTVRLINYWTHYADSFYVADIPWTDSTLFPQHLYEAFYYTCADTAEHIITITNEYLQFPNLVTPNGDGVNDRWEIKNLVEFGNYSMNELWIYDRTGTLIYHVKNIRRTDQFWDPAATRSPDGTYYYRFVAEGEYGVVKRNGLIEVLRK